jgi:hypothetical protein
MTWSLTFQRGFQLREIAASSEEEEAGRHAEPVVPSLDAIERQANFGPVRTPGIPPMARIMVPSGDAEPAGKGSTHSRHRGPARGSRHRTCRSGSHMKPTTLTRWRCGLGPRCRRSRPCISIDGFQMVDKPPRLNSPAGSPSPHDLAMVRPSHHLHGSI